MDDEEALRAEFAAFLAYRAAHAKAEDKRPALTVEQLWDAWFPSVEASARGPNIRTHRRYTVAFTFALRGEQVRLGDLRPADCTPALWEAWKAALRATKNRRGLPLGPDYRDQIRLSMQACFTYHIDTGGLAGRNPLKGVPREEGWKGRRREGFFSPEQLDRFLPHCRPLLAALLTLSFRSGGMRRDEMRLLRKSEVDWDNREIVLAGARTKTGEPRRVLLTDDCAELIQHFSAVSPSDYVFANPNDPEGGPVPQSTLWGWLDEARGRAKLTLAGEPPVIHSARHGFTMRMMDVAPESWIADQLGHRDTTMIAARYGRLRGQQAREKMRAMMEAPPAAAPERKAPMAAPRTSVPQRSKPSTG